jgi:hypothetical protein
VQPVHDAAVERARRPGQAVDQIARRTSGGQRGTEPFGPAGSPHRPGSEQEHPGERDGGKKRLVVRGQTEGGTVIDHELKPYQAPGHGDAAPAGELGDRPRLGHGISRDCERDHRSAPQNPFSRFPRPSRAQAWRRLPRPCIACHVISMPLGRH